MGPKKLSEKEEEKTNDCKWTQLPDDVLRLIMRRLCLADYLGLRAVCSSWRKTIANAIANKHCHPLPEQPLLVLKYAKRTQFFSLSTQRILNPKRPFLFESNNVLSGSVEGWVIVCDYSDRTNTNLSVFFLNPGTDDKIFVPFKLNYPSNSPLERRKQLYIAKMVASSKPHCSGCFLVGLFTDYCHIAFCRLSEDESWSSWTMIEREEEHYFMDVEILGSRLYVRTKSTNRSVSCILVYHLQQYSSDDDPPKPKVLALLPPIRPHPILEIFGNQNQRRVLRSAMFSMAIDEALEELFLIYMHCISIYDAGHVGYLNSITDYTTPPDIFKMEVFKLCLSKETDQFVKVDNLGDRVCFLGVVKSIVMSSATFNSTKELIAANTIYFSWRFRCPESPWHGFQLGQYCLDDKDTNYYSIETAGESEPPYPIWFVPSLW